jgi:hypothetical protein
MAKIVTKAPLDILMMNPERYQEIGETLQMHSCFRMFSLGMGSLRSEATETAITRTIDDYNENYDRMKAQDRNEDSFEKSSAEPDPDLKPRLTRDEMVREIGRWKFIRRCTIQRNTTCYLHQHLEPYTVSDAYAFRMQNTSKDASEVFAQSSAKTLERVTGGLVDADVRFKTMMREGSKNLLSLDKIGRPAVEFVRGIEEIEELPLDWEDEWSQVVRKAANKMTKQFGISDDELINRIAIIQGLDELGDPIK